MFPEQTCNPKTELHTCNTPSFCHTCQSSQNELDSEEIHQEIQRAHTLISLLHAPTACISLITAMSDIALHLIQSFISC